MTSDLKTKPKRMSIEVDYCTYETIKEIADKLQIDMADVLYNPITDHFLEDYYEDELREAEHIELDRDLVEEMWWEESRREVQHELWEEMRQERKLER